MTAATRASIVVGFPCAGPTCFTITPMLSSSVLGELLSAFEV